MPATDPFVGDEGIAWYCGAPGTGKTTLALKHAAALSWRLAWPVLVVDSTHAAQFAGMKHHATVAEVLDGLYSPGRAHACYSPEEPADAEALWRALRAGRRVVVLVDESAFWLSAANGRQGALLRLMRAWRHAELRVLLTTQHLSGDVPQEAFACAPRVYLFRTTSPRALQLAERQWNIDPARLASLRVGAFLEVPDVPAPLAAAKAAG